MTAGDWERVIGEAARLGTRRVVFIGGEPTLHPGLPGSRGSGMPPEMHA